MDIRTRLEPTKAKLTEIHFLVASEFFFLMPSMVNGAINRTAASRSNVLSREKHLVCLCLDSREDYIGLS